MSDTIGLSIETAAGRWRITVGPSGVPSLLEGQDGRVIASFGPRGGERTFELDSPEHLWLLYTELPESRTVRLEPVEESAST